jgi:hypothetical protein
MSIIAPPPITITSAGHRFFDDLATAIASHGALTSGYFAHAQSTIGQALISTTPLGSMSLRCQPLHSCGGGAANQPRMGAAAV